MVPLKSLHISYTSYVTLGESSYYNSSFFHNNLMLFEIKKGKNIHTIAVAFNFFLQNIILFTFSVLPSISTTM
jgi:hypothetical protein